jgi:hypothetical protein
MAATVYTSAQPLMALLNESDADLQGFALGILNAQAQDFWSELTDSLAYLYVTHISSEVKRLFVSRQLYQFHI